MRWYVSYDVNMIYEIRRLVIENLKAELPHISQVEYFSDGCAAQYKNQNKYNFKNLCMLQKHFELVASWVIFAMMMWWCDGNDHVMEQVEQLNVLSLKKVYKIQQVNNLCLHMFNFCQRFFSHITFFSLPQRKSRLLETCYLIILKIWNHYGKRYKVNSWQFKQLQTGLLKY